MGIISYREGSFSFFRSFSFDAGYDGITTNNQCLRLFRAKGGNHCILLVGCQRQSGVMGEIQAEEALDDLQSPPEMSMDEAEQET